MEIGGKTCGRNNGVMTLLLCVLQQIAINFSSSKKKIIFFSLVPIHACSWFVPLAFLQQLQHNLKSSPNFTYPPEGFQWLTGIMNSCYTLIEIFKTQWEASRMQNMIWIACCGDLYLNCENLLKQAGEKCEDFSERTQLK